MLPAMWAILPCSWSANSAKVLWRKNSVRSWQDGWKKQLLLCQKNMRIWAPVFGRQEKIWQRKKRSWKIWKMTGSTMTRSWKRREPNWRQHSLIYMERKCRSLYLQICLILQMKNGKMRWKVAWVVWNSVWSHHRNMRWMRRNCSVGWSSIRRSTWSIRRRSSEMSPRHSRELYMRQCGQKKLTWICVWRGIWDAS